jgi:hypothetical protein
MTMFCEFPLVGCMMLVFGQHGADVNAVDHTGQTALHWSAVRGHIQVAELLLKEGAKVDAADLYGYQVCYVKSLLHLWSFLHHFQFWLVIISSQGFDPMLFLLLKKVIN